MVNILQVASTVTLRLQFGGAVYTTIMPAADWFSVKMLIGTRFINCHVNSIPCIDRQMEITKGKIPLLGSP